MNCYIWLKHSSVLFQSILLDYAKAADPHFDGSKTLTFFSICVSTIVVILEMICYLIFFISIFKYNNGASILPIETRKSRNRANAQTMMGQIYFFLLDIFFMILNVIALGFADKKSSATLKDILVTFKFIELLIISVTHCLLIPEIRNKIMTPFSKIKTLLSIAVMSLFKCLLFCVLG